DSGVTAMIKRGDGEIDAVRVGWLAGCDGAHSAVRHLLELPFEGKTYPIDVLLVDARVDWALSDDEVHVFITEAGLLGVFPMPGARKRVAVDISGIEHGTASFAMCQELVAARAPVAMALSDPGWVSEFHLHA